MLSSSKTLSVTAPIGEVVWRSLPRGSYSNVVGSGPWLSVSTRGPARSQPK
ncbi:MAG: hypothetical protein KF878_09525 [Planctomycetes bacterium]|nr:hypothetical protein [Planctomycetota bacterium]